MTTGPRPRLTRPRTLRTPPQRVSAVPPLAFDRFRDRSGFVARQPLAVGVSICAALAEFEQELIRERTLDGL